MEPKEKQELIALLKKQIAFLEAQPDEKIFADREDVDVDGKKIIITSTIVYEIVDGEIIPGLKTSCHY